MGTVQRMPDESSPDSRGVIVMCMYCRRTLCDSSEGEKSELIEKFITKRPDNVSGQGRDLQHEE
jgi:hypothetical protein